MAETTDSDDGLFLFEVLIDKVLLNKSPCFPEHSVRTCVYVQASGMPSIEICDDDPTAFARSQSPFVKTFNNGKSCLTSLKKSDINKAMSSFAVKVSVYKLLPCGCLPNKVAIGDATIDMTKEFIQARQKYLKDPTSVSYEALKDTFRLKGTEGGGVAGDIIMFLRITCFGKLIMTTFQATGGPPKLSTGGGTVVDRSCQPGKKWNTKEEPCACGACNVRSSKSIGGGAVSTQLGSCKKVQGKYESMPCQEGDDPCYCGGQKPPPPDQMGCRNTDPYCLHVPKGPNKGFEEIGTHQNGNELRIKVPAESSVIKKISATRCTMQRPFSTSAPGPCTVPCGKNQVSLVLPNEAICCKGAAPQETLFSCTTEGCTQSYKHGLQQTGAKNAVKSEKIEVINKDVFVFKVAKTAMQGDKKVRLELEMTAPKGGDKDPPTRKTTRRVQCEPDCNCERLKLPKKKKKCPALS